MGSSTLTNVDSVQNVTKLDEMGRWRTYVELGGLACLIAIAATISYGDGSDKLFKETLGLTEASLK